MRPGLRLANREGERDGHRAVGRGIANGGCGLARIMATSMHNKLAKTRSEPHGQWLPARSRASMRSGATSGGPGTRTWRRSFATSIRSRGVRWITIPSYSWCSSRRSRSSGAARSALGPLPLEQRAAAGRHAVVLRAGRRGAALGRQRSRVHRPRAGARPHAPRPQSPIPPPRSRPVADPCSVTWKILARVRVGAKRAGVTWRSGRTGRFGSVWSSAGGGLLLSRPRPGRLSLGRARQPSHSGCRAVPSNRAEVLKSSYCPPAAAVFVRARRSAICCAENGVNVCTAWSA
jgi:hypothetical protein